MRRFLAWALSIAAAFFVFVGAIFRDVIADFIKQHLQEITDWALKFLHAALKFLHDLTEQTWFLVTASFLVGFAAGFLAKWLLQRLDGSRGKQRETLGIDMLKLVRNLNDFAARVDGDPMNAFRPQITSCFTTAEKLGMWVPDDRIFSIHPPQAMDLITDYLTQVGTMLKDGHFLEAKRDARKSEANFNKLY